MAQSGRIVGDIGQLTVKSLTFSLVLKNVTLEVEISTRDNAAVNDTWAYPKELRRAARLTWTVAAESDDVLAILDTMAAATGDVEHTFIFQPYAGNTYKISGNLIMTRGSQTADEEGSRSFEALVQDAATYAAS